MARQTAGFQTVIAVLGPRREARGVGRVKRRKYLFVLDPGLTTVRFGMSPRVRLAMAPPRRYAAIGFSTSAIIARRPFQMIWTPIQNRMKDVSRIMTLVPVAPSFRRIAAAYR